MECMKDSFVKGQLLDGRFRTVAPLNHGSFGMVFLAEDITTGAEVAIKCSSKQMTGDGVSPQASEDEELYCHQILKHNHLVNLLHHFETGAHTYLVLEYCSQGDLYEAIRSGRGPLETEHVRDFMLQLVSAVEYMHSNGLYHRDIKPENIFITQDGCMKLGDFGLATRATWSYDSCVGSDRYMAPEQYDPAGTGYSPLKADIWSIGICLLNILFSRNPFTTPTESDVLFADFRRDRQSLFDVFPNMSQDTFEILSHALAIDPEKRSLLAVRDAIVRTISFTTDDESLDDFCTEGRDFVRASANREPLRTPSIQSPVLNQVESFPWAQVLRSGPPAKLRQLSAIPDTETYDEDLFPGSEKSQAGSWLAEHHNTPSLASVLDSGLGASFNSMAIRRANKRFPPQSNPVHVSGSLPARAAAKMIPSMSMIFGKKDDGVSKSWSDLWEEEAEESEQEDLLMKQRREQNSRSFSHDSHDSHVSHISHDSQSDDVTVRLDEPPVRRPEVLSEKSHSASNIPSLSDFKAALPTKQSCSPDENGVFEVATPRVFKYSSLGKSNSSDKWAALGKKRRNYQPAKDSFPAASKKRSVTTNRRKDWGLNSSGNDAALSYHRSSRGSQHVRPVWLDQDWRRDQHPLSQHKPVYDGADDDLEWVGGWHAFHL
jgi:serine/threonine protein kinase